MKNFVLLLLSICVFSSCDSDAVETVTVEDRFSIDLPSFLVEGDDLNEDASLQYQNIWKEFYVIVIEDSKAELEAALTENGLTELYSIDINGYSELLLDGFSEGINSYNASEVTDTTINNMPARLLTVNGEVDGLDVFYSIAYIEGEEQYYQILTWTLADKENKYKEKMGMLLNSFKEL